ncbi:Mid2 domain-containing protein [Madurella fahalii]|uniref:Mid2 domain-containing protein n=1 Tax=Madurella fahalii TaxID=1157608 RepID=A0ABQ0GQI0_9PEZI
MATSIGVLTTVFTPPADCASSTGIHVVGCGDRCAWWAEGPLGAAHCYPTSYNPSLNHYYSPGICPSGYTAACTSLRSIAQVTETIQTCCPTALGYHYRCVRPTWPWQSSLGCTVYFADATSTFSFPTVTSIRDGSTVVRSTARTEVGIGAYGVEIRFQSTDFAPRATTISSSSSTGTDAAATTGSPTLSTTPQTSIPTSAGSGPNSGGSSSSSGVNSEPSGGLPVAAQAGIGVGVGIFGVLCILCAVLWFRYLKRQERAFQELQARSLPYHTGPAEGWKAEPAPVHITQYYPAELDPQHQRPPVELGI